MFAAIVYIAVSLIILSLVISAAWDVFMQTESKPYQPRHGWEYRPVHSNLIGQTIRIPVNDDTQQMSWFDRELYMESHERMVATGEWQFLPTMQEIYQDIAQWDAFLNEGTLAVAHWLRGKEVA
jgi:hypothetical protein